MRAKILLYTDCPFFAGCENMIGILLSSPEIAKEYDLTLAYRYSRVYRVGLENRAGRSARQIRVQIVDSSRIFRMLRLDGDKSAIASSIQRFAAPFLFAVCLIFNTVRIFSVFAKERPYLAHINNGGYPGAESAYAAVLAAWLAGVPRIIYVVNNQAVSYRSLLRLVQFPLDLVVARYVTIFITASRSARLKLSSVLGLPSRKLLTVRNSVRRFSIAEGRLEVRRRLRVPEGAFTVLVVANLERRKGVIYAVQAFEFLCRNAGTNTLPLLLIEGRGNDEAVLKDYVRNHRISNVRFLQRQDDILSVMAAVESVLLPSIGYEDFPNVVLEAMGVGTLVIASAIAGIPEQISDFHTGLLVRPGSVDDIVQAVRYAMQNPGKVQEMVAEAGRTFNNLYTFRHGILRYRELYEQLLQSRHGTLSGHLVFPGKRQQSTAGQPQNKNTRRYSGSET